jgi:hypothetical protein
MQRGDIVKVRRGSKIIAYEVIRDHSVDDPPFPAVTLKSGPKGEMIVGLDEILTKEELEALEQKETNAQKL